MVRAIVLSQLVVLHFLEILADDAVATWHVEDLPSPACQCISVLSDLPVFADDAGFVPQSPHGLKHHAFVTSNLAA